MRMSWKLSKHLLEPSGFSFQRHHCWHCGAGFSGLTETIPNLVSLKLIRQKIFAQYKTRGKVGHEVNDLLFISRLLQVYWSLVAN